MFNMLYHVIICNYPYDNFGSLQCVYLECSAENEAFRIVAPSVESCGSTRYCILVTTC